LLPEVSGQVVQKIPEIAALFGICDKKKSPEKGYIPFSGLFPDLALVLL
jgi:hypothetical protein